jgi:hypothetical protein
MNESRIVEINYGKFNLCSFGKTEIRLKPIELHRIVRIRFSDLIRYCYYSDISQNESIKSIDNL